jgi:PAS domain S-box-containing protein
MPASGTSTDQGVAPISGTAAQVATLLDAVRDPAKLINGHGHLVYVNRAFEARLGWTLETLGSTPPFVAWPAERRVEYQLLVQRLLRDGEASSHRTFSMELLDTAGNQRPFDAHVVLLELKERLLVWVLREPGDPRARLTVLERSLRRLTAELHQLGSGQAHAAQVAMASLLADRERLSAQQRVVLELFARGGSVAQIAEQLGRSPHTVRGHLKAIYTRLGIGTQDELRALLDSPDTLDETTTTA